MKLLLENWRKYEKEVLQEDMDPEKVKRFKAGFRGALGVTDEDVENMRVLASIGDPTGILSWKDVGTEYEAYKKKPSKANAGWLALAILSAIPGLKYFGAPAKAKKLADLAKWGKGTGKMIGRACLREGNAGNMIGRTCLKEGCSEVAKKITAAALKAEKVLKAAAARAGKITRSRRNAPPSVIDRGGRFDQAKQAAVRRAAWKAAAPTFLGMRAAVNANGKKLGVFLDDKGRVFVNMQKAQGEEIVTFMHSSGTSYLMKSPSGHVVASPKAWIPVGPYTTLYRKYSPLGSSTGIPDARFGKGDQKLWDNLLETTDEMYKKLSNDFGHDWAHDIWKPGAKAIRADLEKFIKAGHIKHTQDHLKHGLGKYPEPSSVFGRMGAELKKLSPGGSPEELEKYFGRWKTGSSTDYNAWRAGQY